MDGIGRVIAAVLLSLGGSQAPTISPQYQFALQRAQYLVSTADVNGDGSLNVLVKAQLNMTFVDLDVLVPIVLKPANLSVPLSKSRHRLDDFRSVPAKAIFGGLHHEYSLARASTKPTEQIEQPGSGRR